MSEEKKNRQQLACDYIHENYVAFNRLRYDLIAQKVQVCEERWRYITNADINSIVCDCCAETGANITAKEILTVLNAGSSYIPRVHPLRDYVLSLKPYTPDQPDWIDMVARQVHVKGNDKTECGINKDNLNNHSYLAQWARTIITASPTLLSGSEYIYQQYQQLEINNNNNSLASANVGRAQMLFKLSLIKNKSPLSSYSPVRLPKVLWQK